LGAEEGVRVAQNELRGFQQTSQEERNDFEARVKKAEKEMRENEEEKEATKTRVEKYKRLMQQLRIVTPAGPASSS
jgi:hypothetical protein